VFEIGQLLASAGTELFQEHEVVPRLIELPGFDVELA